MSVAAGSFTPGGTGNISVTGLTFLPNELTFRVGNGSSDDTSAIARCDSWCTDSNKSYDAFYYDNTGVKQVKGTDKCIRYIRRVSGTISDVTVATLVSFDDNGGGDYGFTLNFTAAGSYQVRFLARG